MNDNDRINKLRDISPVVEDYVANKRYLGERNTVENEQPIVYDDRMVLNNCYMLIIDELKNIGVCLDGDYSDLLSNFYDTRHIETLRIIYEFNMVKYLLSLDQTVADSISNLLSSGTDPSSIIGLITDHLAHKVLSEEEMGEFTSYMFDKLHASAEYVVYMNSIIEQLPIDSTPGIAYIDDTMKLIEYIDKAHDIVMHIIKIAYEINPKIDMKHLIQNYQIYSSMLKADKINSSTYWYINKGNLNGAYSKATFQGTVTNEAIAEIASNLEDIILVMATVRIENPDNNEFIQRVIKLRNALIAAHDLTEEDINFIDALQERLRSVIVDLPKYEKS